MMAEMLQGERKKDQQRIRSARWYANPANKQKTIARARVRHQADVGKYVAYHQEYRKKNSAQIAVAGIRRRHGIVLGAIPAKPERCELCNKSTTLCLDHCHTTGKFRGWLCHKCNLTLGQFGDDPALFRAAADYLESAG